MALISSGYPHYFLVDELLNNIRMTRNGKNNTPLTNPTIMFPSSSVAFFRPRNKAIISCDIASKITNPSTRTAHSGSTSRIGARIVGRSALIITNKISAPAIFLAPRIIAKPALTNSTGMNSSGRKLIGVIPFMFQFFANWFNQTLILGSYKYQHDR